MQMPQMAKDVFMAGFIVSTGVAVKSQLSAKESFDHRKWDTETFY
jgi:hypothetical protein